MGHYDSQYENENYERDQRDKKMIEESLANLSKFVQTSYTAGIQHEIESIRKYYQSRLYELRYVNIDS